MTLSVILFAFFVGIVIGSFLNVVILRYNTGISIGGRSFCFSCGKRLRWHELIPIFSFLLQKGKCGGCRSSISIQYPLVEWITGVMFAATVFYFFGQGTPSTSTYVGSVAVLAAFSTLIVIAFYDIRHKIIPDGAVYAFMALSLVVMAATLRVPVGVGAFAEAFSGGPVVALPLFILWMVSSGRWIGFGDVKLALGMGWLLGPIYGISALILGFWIGAIYGLAVMAFQRISKFFGLPQSGMLLKMKSEVPFGPFLILATFIIFFFPLDILGVSRLISI